MKKIRNSHLCKLSKTPMHLPSKHSSWWRRLSSSSLEDVFKTFWSRRTYWPYSYVFKTSWRRLDQDQYIRLGHTSSRRLQDVFKTSSRLLQGVFKMSSRHLQDVLERFLQDACKTYHEIILLLLTFFNMSSRRIHNVSEAYHRVGYLHRRIYLGHTS